MANFKKITKIFSQEHFDFFPLEFFEGPANRHVFLTYLIAFFIYLKTFCGVGRYFSRLTWQRDKKRMKNKGKKDGTTMKTNLEKVQTELCFET